MDMSVVYLASIAVLSCSVVPRLLETAPVVATRQVMRRNITR